MKNLETLLNQLESRIPLYAKENLTISKSNIGWHMEHSLLVINGITKALLKSDPKEYQWKFNFIKILVLNRGKIPRGKVKAPEVVVPNKTIEEATLLTHITQTRNSLLELESISNNHYFEHPLLGKLKKKDTIRFLEIHTNHHLKIIEDIIKS
ncbi:MAG: DUF1569 domain-containing protein [Flavobacterium sp.]|jgi:hypothetical protein|nr:DUF1569 domain-containing protein [Flavobacterium sp.]